MPTFGPRGEGPAGRDRRAEEGQRRHSCPLHTARSARKYTFSVSDKDFTVENLAGRQLGPTSERFFSPVTRPSPGAVCSVRPAELGAVHRT